jgi:hypothetical protein
MIGEFVAACIAIQGGPSSDTPLSAEPAANKEDARDDGGPAVAIRTAC